MSSIEVIGGRSGIGFNAVKIGLAQGHYVHAFSRSIESLELDHPRLSHFLTNSLTL